MILQSQSNDFTSIFNMEERRGQKGEKKERGEKKEAGINAASWNLRIVDLLGGIR